MSKKYKQVPGFETLNKHNMQIYAEDQKFIIKYTSKIENICGVSNVESAFMLKFKMENVKNKITNPRFFNGLSRQMTERLKRFIIICMTIEYNELCKTTVYSGDFLELVEQIVNNIKEEEHGKPITRNVIDNMELEIKIEDILKMENK